MLSLYKLNSGAFREIIISRATSGGRREIEFNSGSLPPIPGGLATPAESDAELFPGPIFRTRPDLPGSGPDPTRLQEPII